MGDLGKAAYDLATKALKGLVTDAQKIVTPMTAAFVKHGNYPAPFTTLTENTKVSDVGLTDTYLDPGTIIYKGVGYPNSGYTVYSGFKRTFTGVKLGDMGFSYDSTKPVKLNLWFYLKTINRGDTYAPNGIYIGANKINVLSGSEVTTTDMGNGWTKYKLEHTLTQSDFQQNTFDRFEVAYYGNADATKISTQEFSITGLFAYVGDISLGSYFGNNAATALANDLNALTTRQRRWKGLKAYFCGDSITENRLYQAPLSSKLGLASYTTDGNPGQAVSGCTSKIVANPSLLDGHDLLTILAGTNDFGGNITLGTISSPADTTTTYGSLKLAISTVCTAKPNLRVALMTPLPRGKFDTQPAYGAANGQGKLLTDYVNAVREVGQYYHIPVLDFYNLIGWNEFNVGSKTNDNLHPNAQGNNDMVPMMASFLEQL